VIRISCAACSYAVKHQRLLQNEENEEEEVDCQIASKDSCKMLRNAVRFVLIVAAAVTDGAHQFFSQEPADVSAVQGGQVILPCQVQNKGGTLQWTKDGFGLGQSRSLPGFPRLSMVGQDISTDWSLSISPVLLGDEGVYQCQVTSTSTGIPPIRSSLARLIVTIPSDPPTIIAGNHIMVTEGREEDIICKAEGGKPAAQLEWKTGGLKIKNIQTKAEKIPGTVTFKTVSILKFVPLRSDDGVSVTCMISTTEESSTALLSVMYKPVVKLSHDRADIMEGDRVVFTCTSSSPPGPVLYTWVVGGKVQEGSEAEFVVDKMSREQDQVVVECRVENSVGTGQDEEVVTVYYQPSILTHPTSVSGKEGATVQLECQVQGNPQPDISWYRGNTSQLVGTGNLLKIFLDNSSLGVYYCSAYSSRFPSAVISKSARVSIMSAPLITSAQVTWSGSLAMVTCRADTSGLEVTVHWSHEGQSIQLGDKYLIENLVKEQHFESILTINETEEDDFGSYCCSLRNELGEDSKDILLSVTHDGVFNDFLLLQIFLGTAALLTCILSIVAVRRFCYNIHHSFGSVAQVVEDEHSLRFGLYEEKDLDKDSKGDKEYKVMNQVSRQEAGTDICPGNVLQSINMDYAAFYGNPHLSNNMMEEDTEEEEEEEERTFSSHPYLIT